MASSSCTEEDSKSSSLKKTAAETDDDGDDTDADDTDSSNNNEEEEEEVELGGEVGEPAEGEFIRFNRDLNCESIWILDGVVAECSDCDLAFDLSRELAELSTCSEGESDTGRLSLQESSVYFDGAYWGTVYTRGDGYLTWNTVGYFEGAEAFYYYIGYVRY